VVAVDLFSDTVTRPTPAMRRAMAEAEVGDEQQREDPTVNLLQEIVAELLGKESALFLPSGTMCNQVAFAVHCRAGDEILLQEQAHPLLYEVGGATALIGALLRPLSGGDPFFTADQVRAAIRPPAYYMPRTRAVSIEQTSAVAGGVCWPVEQIEQVCNAAHEGGLVTHMDGARLLNAVVASGTSARRFAAGFDSVWMSDHFFLSLGRYGGDDRLHGSLEPLTTLAAVAALFLADPSSLLGPFAVGLRGPAPHGVPSVGEAGGHAQRAGATLGAEPDRMGYRQDRQPQDLGQMGKGTQR
jgi:hypothetical protein